jgi:ABC-type branched-subunit amino acid transport system permease subunit
VRIADMALLYIMLALGLNIVVGFAGLLDLGYIAFYAVGAYMAGLLASPQFATCWNPDQPVSGLGNRWWPVGPRSSRTASTCRCG